MNEFFEIKKEGLTKQDFLDADPKIDLTNIDDNFCIKSVSTLENAKEGDLSFFVVTIVSGNKYKHTLENSKCSFCLIKPQYASLLGKNTKAIFTNEPYITFTRLCKKLLVEKSNNNANEISSSSKIAKFVSIGNGVKIGDNVEIEDFVKIGNGVKIGDNCIIKSGVKIGNNVEIGKNCSLNENCVVQYSIINDNVCIHANASIGQDGFGYAMDARTGMNEKINHFGCVKIGNNVEIGANTCIDRGVFDATIVEENVKIDNLVQIAHNVKIGRNTMIAGQSAIAGSATIGSYCMLGGKSGVAGHIKLGDQSILYGATNISKSFPSHSKIIGTPGELYHNWVRNYAILQHLMHKQNKKNRYKQSVKLNAENNLINRLINSLKWK